jgi:hypothetical protein
MPRWFVLLLLVVGAAGCPQSTADLASGGDDDARDPPPSGTNAFCVDDSDCELASATCCGCKAFATSANDPKLDACDSVECPPPQSTCSRVRAVCDQEQHRCAVACEPQVVTSSCASGFASDAVGCLVDACAQPENECALDTDCVQTRADCCGCARGGNDTAVSKATRASYEQELGCSGNESCPEVTTCDASETPQCAQGACKLIAGGLPADACGRPDLPACPTGTVCTVNASDPANLHGVGVCRTP